MILLDANLLIYAYDHRSPFHKAARNWIELVLTEGQARGALCTDAALAALAIEYGATLYTADRGFARFSGLRFVNPLAG